LAGADHARATWLSPGVAVRPVGASGTVAAIATTADVAKPTAKAALAVRNHNLMCGTER
jgi:hypothetical protein